ncbi:hypothetical protein COLO4_07597 [Corchorus olitorius]|uniref:Uncharacterized protein n=1 Tax=Corchorus olitorius TaxID=93759 RepID=A0A1R3KJ72_9ROSI|nr:hypothetical protein COLO4_07597 [Corchorus olitorius]
MPPRKVPAKRARQDESTSSSAPARQVFDRQKFKSLESQMWYNGTNNKDLLVEKSVSGWIEGEYHISEKFQTLGWSPILTLEGVYYPELFMMRDGVWINPFRVDEQELDDSDEEWVESEEEEEEENEEIAPPAANAEELSDRELLMNLVASVNALRVKVDHMQGTLDQLVASQRQQPPSP